jgi:hypothetical protein
MSGKPAEEIAASKARMLVGKVLFGDDWIGELRSSDLRLLEGEHGIKQRILPNGQVIRIIAPCPPNRRNQLDMAIGRVERGYVQHSTVIDVMHDAGFSDLAKAYDLANFEHFLKNLRRPELHGRSRGKPRDKIEDVKRRMESDMRGGIDLNAMKGKALAAKYRVSRGTAVNARREVLEKYARK